MLDSFPMAGDEGQKPSFARLRLGSKPKRRVTGWEPQAFLFDALPPSLTEETRADEATPLEAVAHVEAKREVAVSPVPKAARAGLRGLRPVVREPAEPRVWTVRALVTGIREHVEAGYADVWVEGEISNCRPAASGHLYFTLKDGEAQLPVVLFRRQAGLLRFRPKDGDEVRLRGRISVYESRGQLQMIGETMELRGAGALQLAFDRLKARLLAEGLFAAERKRRLPAFPKCIGVVTSASGAVIQDIVNVVRRRHGRLNLLVYPATMQGPQCAGSVAAGIRWFNAHPERVEVILIARGGGSFEDLAGFNDERLARTIAASELPVVSAIGHETDFTIADFAADLRAPTPSAAAELITAAQHKVEERVEALARRARRAVAYQVLRVRQRLDRLSAEAVLGRLRDGVARREQRVDDLRFRLEAAMGRRARRAQARVEGLGARVLQQDPRLRLAASHGRLAAAEACLVRAVQAGVARRKMRLAHATARLEAMSPLAVLSRGYALVYAEGGGLLRDAVEVAPGARVRARLARGTVFATVTETERR